VGEVPAHTRRRRQGAADAQYDVRSHAEPQFVAQLSPQAAEFDDLRE
jgi:hypothetical protein